jgi:hypothetical protein
VRERLDSIQCMCLSLSLSLSLSPVLRPSRLPTSLSQISALSLCLLPYPTRVHGTCEVALCRNL